MPERFFNMVDRFSGKGVERRFFEEVFNACPDPTVIVQCDGTIVMGNAAFGRMTEQLESPHPVKCREILCSDSGEALDNCPLHAILRTGKPVSRTSTHRLSSGQQLTLIVNAAPIRGDDGEVAHVVLNWRDITPQLQAEQALVNSQAEFRTLFDASMDAMILMDTYGGVIRVNRAAVRLYGFPSEAEILTRGVTCLLPESQPDGEVSDRRFRRVMAEAIERTTVEGEWTHVRSDGEPFDALVRMARMVIGGKTIVQMTVHDIGLRKSAERALRESEERYRGVVDNIGIGIGLIDTDMRVISVNPQMKRWFPDVDFSGCPLCHHVFNDPPSDEPCSYCPTLKTLNDGKTHEAVAATPRDGGVHYYRIISSPLRDDRGRTTGAIEMVDDIDAQVRAQAEMETLARLPGENPNPVFRVSSDLRILFNNKAALPLFEAWDWRLDTPLTGLWSEVVSDALASNEAKQVEVECGDRFYSVTLAPVADEGYVNAYALDITDRRQVEEALNETKGLLEERVQERTRELERINENLTLEIAERRKAEKKLSLHQDHLEDMVQQRTFELTGINEKLQVEIAERRRAEQALRKTTEDLEQTNRQLKENQSQLLQTEKMASIGQLAAGVAHEINNPVGFVTSNLETLQDYMETFEQAIAGAGEIVAALEGGSGSVDAAVKEKVSELAELNRREKIDDLLEDVRDLVRESIDGTRRVRDIVQGLKSFSRVNEASEKEADINDCIETTLKVVWNELKYKCQVSKKLGAIPQTLCFPGQLNQVFMNLLVNAAQSIAEYGEVTIETAQENDRVVVRISDTGCGIPEENVPKLFNPFFTTKDVGKGTGLGLAISYGIVQKHEGEIEVDSEVGKGTTFTIRLPVRRSKAA